MCKCRAQATLTVHGLQPLLSTFVRTCFDKNAIWVHYNTLAYDFTSVVLMRMLPGALNSFSLLMTLLLFCWEHFVVPTLLLNWIHTKIISAAAFHTIGLAKNFKNWIPFTRFDLPFYYIDKWRYFKYSCSITSSTVSYSVGPGVKNQVAIATAAWDVRTLLCSALCYY